jgi:small basic protein
LADVVVNPLLPLAPFSAALRLLLGEQMRSHKTEAVRTVIILTNFFINVLLAAAVLSGIFRSTTNRLMPDLV